MRAFFGLLLLPACVMRGVLPAEGVARAQLSEAVPRTVRCETGSVPVELANWRAAVERSYPFVEHRSLD